MADRTIIEFYSTRKVGQRIGFVLAIETDAPPPANGSLVNIKGEDHLVLDVQYSIDQPTYGPKTYRRNVIMRLKDAE